MTFKTYKSSELSGIYELISGSTGERNYPLVEASFFGNYFVVDGQQTEVDEHCEVDFGRRYFVSNFLDAMSLIVSLEKQGIKHENISLLQGSNVTDSEDYNSSIIEQITHCHDEAGQNAWLFELKNGGTAVESPLTKNSN